VPALGRVHHHAVDTETRLAAGGGRREVVDAFDEGRVVRVRQEHPILRQRRLVFAGPRVGLAKDLVDYEGTGLAAEGIGEDE